ncbi:MAG TPA: hypothetical protein VFG54_16365 [Prolixibacteraceae bacterium]|nr:hypothetical protein [Prolixibacteraceae bacterium]
MKKFLIEVPHGVDKQSCAEAIQVFQHTSSHFLTHAEWGCLDGEHKAWIIVEVENKEEALFIVPPLYRSSAKIVQLTTFTAKDLLEPEKFHPQG